MSRVWPLVLLASLSASVAAASSETDFRGPLRALDFEVPEAGRRSVVEAGVGATFRPAGGLAEGPICVRERPRAPAEAAGPTSEPGSVSSGEGLIAWPPSGYVASNLGGAEGASVAIFGTAEVADLGAWVLEYGEGTSPRRWLPLAAGLAAPDGLRLGTWETDRLEDGIYVLRLTGTDSAGRTRRVTVPVRVALAAVSAVGMSLDVSRGEVVELRSTLAEPTYERLEMRDDRGTTVRTLVDEWRPAGVYSDVWNGLRDDGARLPDGQYRWVATFGSDMCSLVVDKSDQRDGDAEVKGHPEYPPWDAFENKPLRFSHTFDRPGEIVLVFSRDTYDVRLSCDPPRFFCRFLDGYHPGGAFSYEWAGVDDEGRYRDDINAIFVVSHHEDLSRNGVIVHGGHPALSGMAVFPTLFRPGVGPQVVRFRLSCFGDERVNGIVTWTNQESLSVLKTESLLGIGSGMIEIGWDGRADAGDLVAPGRYTVAVVITDRNGQTARGEALTRVEY